MSTLLLTHPVFLRHEPGPLHPERPARMCAIDAALSGDAFAGLRREEAPLRQDAEAAILRAHDRDHLERLRALSADRDRLPAFIDGDTVGLRAVDAVMDPVSGMANAFCQVRPPGHHAGRDRAMGFCFLSTAAVAALYARAQYRARRVAVVDFDVHHGNGTQDIMERDPGLFYASSHQYPCYPGTGSAGETGVANNVVNIPLRPGTAGPAFREAWEGVGLPALEAWNPGLLVISAGFDAHRADPLAQLRLDTEDFGWITDRLLAVADRCCGGRVVSVLEGGYDLPALAASAALHVRRLMRQ